MINWDALSNDIAQYFKSNRANNENDTADFISKKYDQYIKFGLNQYSEGLLSTNRNILKPFFYLAFSDAKRGKDLKEVSKRISTGIVLYWNSVIMKQVVPPPGSIQVVYNKIIFAGVPFTFNIINTYDSSLLAKSMVTAFKFHTNTIKGITVSLVPVGTTTIPKIYYWSGIR